MFERQQDNFLKETITMKASLFNLFFTYDDGTILGYNSKTMGLIELNKKEYEAYKLIANGENPGFLESSERQQIISEFEKGNFLIDNEVDELARIKVMYDTNRYLSTSAAMTIVVTHKCNLACTYCYEERQPHSQTNKDIPGIMKFIDVLLKEKRAKTFGVTWFGGEPLLKPSFIVNLSKRIIRRCKKDDIMYSSVIVTNGTLLTRETAKRLREHSVSRAQITLDGPPDTHDKRRPFTNGKGSFETILENIKQVHDFFKISIRVNVDMNNAEKAVELLELLDSRNIKRNVTVNFAPVQPYTDRCSPIANACYSKEEFSGMEISLLAESIARGFTIDISACLPRTKFINCGAVSLNSFVIDAKGQLHKCWNYIGNDDEAIANLSLSNPPINEGEIEAQSNLPAKDNLTKWIAFDPFQFEKCKSCKILPSCLGGCVYPAVVENGEPRCPTWKFNMKERVWLYRQCLMNEKKTKSSV